MIWNFAFGLALGLFMALVIFILLWMVNMAQMKAFKEEIQKINSNVEDYLEGEEVGRTKKKRN